MQICQAVFVHKYFELFLFRLIKLVIVIVQAWKYIRGLRGDKM